jgi:hypothetical protein
MIKMDVKKVAAANRRLYQPPPVVKTLVPTSQQMGQSWRYTTDEPRVGWYRAGFSDTGWQEGKGGFGTEGTPGSVIGTEWNSPGIWMRRTFELDSIKFSRPQLLIHHDEDAEVYINSQLVAKLKGHTSGYIQFKLDEKGQKTLKVGSNCLAVHCSQTQGGQYIDVGLVDIVEK